MYEYVVLGIFEDHLTILCPVVEPDLVATLCFVPPTIYGSHIIGNVDAITDPANII